MIEPIFNLSVHEIRNRDGVLDPSTYTRHASLGIVDSPHGQAFDTSVATTTSGLSVPVAMIPGLDGGLGTLLVRFRVASGAGNNVFVIGNATSGQSRFATAGSATANLINMNYRTATAAATTVTMTEAGGNDWIWAAYRWFGSRIRLRGPSVVQDRTNNGGVPFAGSLILGNASSRNAQTESVLIYDQWLSDDQMIALAAMSEGWTFENTKETLTELGTIKFPTGYSGITLAHPQIRLSDLMGNEYDEITDDVISCRLSSDIDRAGAKNRVSLSAVGLSSDLDVGTWISVRQDIAREGHGRKSVRRGVFELGQPEISTRRSTFQIENSGDDLVDLLSRSACLDTFYTPMGGWQLGDAINNIRMAGLSQLGPNIIPNFSFENGLTGWTLEGSAAGSTVVQTSTNWGSPAPDGDNVLAFVVNTGATNSQYRRVYISNIKSLIPSGTRSLFMSYMVYMGSTNALEGVVELRITTPDGYVFQSPKWWSRSGANRWERMIHTFDLPEVYSDVLIMVGTRPTASMSPLAAVGVMGFDDIRVQPCVGSLLPESIVEFPGNDTVAVRRIQHISSDSRITAVNDRLDGLGFMAVNAKTNSRYTTRRGRNINTDTPSRVYVLGEDARLVGEVKLGRSTTNLYNRVYAILEDFETKTKMVAVAENTDQSDSWSIYKRVMKPRYIYVTDAVSQAELQEIADSALARATVQESITLDIVPDGEMTVYDIIEIIAPEGHPAAGRWAVEHIEDDLKSTNPLMQVGARRTRNRGN